MDEQPAAKRRCINRVNKQISGTQSLPKDFSNAHRTSTCHQDSTHFSRDAVPENASEHRRGHGQQPGIALGHATPAGLGQVSRVQEVTCNDSPLITHAAGGFARDANATDDKICFGMVCHLFHV